MRLLEGSEYFFKRSDGSTNLGTYHACECCKKPCVVDSVTVLSKVRRCHNLLFNACEMYYYENTNEGLCLACIYQKEGE